LIPKKIQKVNNIDLKIEWDNGTGSLISLMNLRKFCPCAVCVAEKEEHGDSYIPIYMKDQVTLSAIKPVGNYALAVEWKDGHNTGIYSYDYLQKLTGKVN
jgi:DUF971 family protein